MSTLRTWLALPDAEPAEDYGFFGPDSAPMIAQTNVSVGLQDFHLPLRAATWTGTVSGTTRIRFTPN